MLQISLKRNFSISLQKNVLLFSIFLSKMLSIPLLLRIFQRFSDQLSSEIPSSHFHSPFIASANNIPSKNSPRAIRLSNCLRIERTKQMRKLSSSLYSSISWLIMPTERLQCLFSAKLCVFILIGLGRQPFLHLTIHLVAEC